MSRFSYSLDVGEELEREKEVKRKIALSRGKEDEEEAVRLDPKFEQEIQQLAEETHPVQADDESIVITPVRREPVKPVRASRPVKAAKQPAPAPKPTQPTPKVAQPVLKAQKSDAPKKIPLAPIQKSGPDPTPAPKPEPAVSPAPIDIQPRTPGEGSGRLILALLLVTVIAVVLIYSGLASKEQASVPPLQCYAAYALSNNLTVVSLQNVTGPQQYWFKRALLADNEAESAAILRMMLCDGNLTQDSKPLRNNCDVGDKAIAVSESDLKELLKISTASACDDLEDVILCDNGYLIDGLIASKEGLEPEHLVAKSGGAYTIIDFQAGQPESVVVVSDKNNKYFSYVVPSDAIPAMGLKLFVGDAFSSFKRVYLDHQNEVERVVLYQLI